MLVNGKRVNISSYQVKEGDMVEMRGKAKQFATDMARRNSPSAMCRITCRRP